MFLKKCLNDKTKKILTCVMSVSWKQWLMSNSAAGLTQMREWSTNCCQAIILQLSNNYWSIIEWTWKKCEIILTWSQNIFLNVTILSKIWRGFRYSYRSCPTVSPQFWAFEIVLKWNVLDIILILTSLAF